MIEQKTINISAWDLGILTELGRNWFVVKGKPALLPEEVLHRLIDEAYWQANPGVSSE